MLARRFPEAEVLGVTLSPAQVRRGKELAAEQGLTNVDFVVQDALKLSEAFEGGEFDLVWACESGEHMPDKQLYVEEMARMLAPGGGRRPPRRPSPRRNGRSSGSCARSGRTPTSSPSRSSSG